MPRTPAKLFWPLALGVFCVLIQPRILQQGSSITLAAELPGSGGFTDMIHQMGDIQQSPRNTNKAVRAADAEDSPSLLFGGDVSDPTKYPWAASILLTHTDTKTKICGASLIAVNFVLTSALCVTENYNPATGSIGTVVPTAGVKVGGIYSYYNRTDEPNQAVAQISTVQSSSIKRHENFSFVGTRGLVNDIALIKIPSVTPSQYIQPIQLPATAGVGYAGSRVEILGWGQTEAGGGSPILKEAVVTMQNDSTCIGYWNCPGNDTIYSASTMSCYGGPGQASVCYGDSGSSVIVRENGVPVLAAVKSFFRLVNEPVGCQRRMRSLNGDGETDGAGHQARQSGWLLDIIQRLGGYFTRQKSKITDVATTTLTTAGASTPATTATTTATTMTPTTRPNRAFCNPDHPAIGVRISNYLVWINRSMAAMLIGR